MAEAEYTTTARLPVEAIWDFVQEMDNWARFVTGYQSHEKQGDSDSVWTLKGDVGVLARTLTFQVHITEWAGPERVEFELTGINEQMSGGGSFTMEPYETAAQAPQPAQRRGRFARWIQAILRLLFRWRHGSAQRAETAAPGPGQGTSRLTFRLRLDPGGPMAPMINAMMTPMLLPAAEDLANRIMAHLEAQQAGSKPSPRTNA